MTDNRGGAAGAGKGVSVPVESSGRRGGRLSAHAGSWTATVVGAAHRRRPNLLGGDNQEQGEDAEETNAVDLMRLVALRSPVPAQAAGTRIYVGNHRNRWSDFEVRNEAAAGQSPGERDAGLGALRALIAQADVAPLRATPKPLGNVEAEKNDVPITEELALAFDAFLTSYGDAPEPNQISEWVRNMIGATVGQLVAGESFAAARTQVHAVLLQALRPPDEWTAATLAKVRVYALRACRLIALLEKLASKEPLADGAAVHWWMSSAPVVVPESEGPAGRLLRPPVLADLKVVRTGKTRYLPGAIAHIQNVMQTEHLVRDHQVLHQLEQTTQTTTERTNETTSELATSNRSMLQNAVSSALDQSTDLQVGVQISASYGPTVQANLDSRVAMHHSRQDASQAAAEYSTEITRRASERIIERTQEVRTIRELMETKDQDRHEFDNTDGQGHVRGVYRWVDSVQDCWVENYGQRLMLDILVPRPGALLRWAAKQQSASSQRSSPVEPPPPSINNARLSPQLIDRVNYLTLVGEYGAGDVPVPPAPTVDLGLSWKGESEDADTYVFSDSTLVVPLGYRATGWSAHCVTWGTSKPGVYATLLLSVGGYDDIKSDSTTLAGDDSNLQKKLAGGLDLQEKSVIPVVALGRGMQQLALGLRVRCELTAAGLAAWQQKVYDAIMVAHSKRHDAWAVAAARAEEQRVAAAMFEVDSDGNPAENRETERRELRRAVVELLLGHPSHEEQFARGALVEVDGEPPQIEETISAAGQGDVLFFEQAFEWRNMSWVLYPYYWEGATLWSADSVRAAGSDPTHAAFLTSGAARVVVPVRVGFESVVNFFLATGITWNGTDVPTIGDSTYLAISDEIADALGTGAVPLERVDLDPIHLPTSLLWLQPTGDLTDT